VVVVKKPNQFFIHGDVAVLVLEGHGGVVRGHTVIDLEDLERVLQYRWYFGIRGYTVTNVSIENGKRTLLYLHHFLIGKPPKGKEVDHRNRRRFDNRKKNLYFVTRGLNSHNCKRTGTSIYKGVYFDKRHTKWKAQIMKEHKRYNIGTYSTEKEAALAYNKVASQLYGEDAVLNKA